MVMVLVVSMMSRKRAAHHYSMKSSYFTLSAFIAQVFYRTKHRIGTGIHCKTQATLHCSSAVLFFCFSSLCIRVHHVPKEGARSSYLHRYICTLDGSDTCTIFWFTAAATVLSLSTFTFYFFLRKFMKLQLVHTGNSP